MPFDFCAETLDKKQDLALCFSSGFADVAKVEQSWINLPDRPGIGFEAQNALYAVMRDVAAG